MLHDSVFEHQLAAVPFVDKHSSWRLRLPSSAIVLPLTCPGFPVVSGIVLVCHVYASTEFLCRRCKKQTFAPERVFQNAVGA